MALTKFTTGSRGPDHLTRPPEYKPLPKVKAKPKPRSSGPDHLTKAESYRPLPVGLSVGQSVPIEQVVAQPAPTSVAQALAFQHAQPRMNLAGQEPVVVSVAQPQQPLAVELIPDTSTVSPVVLNRDPAALVAESDWINSPTTRALKPVTSTSPGVPEDERVRRQTMENVVDYYNSMAEMGQRDATRRKREDADRKEKRKELTIEEWNAYSPLQQAGVQANQDLYEAIRRDFRDVSKHGGKPEGERRTNDKLGAYQDRIGELGLESLGYKGLEYAPNTLAFLDERGIKMADLAGMTLDDLISGDVLMTRETIDQLSPDYKQPTGALGERVPAGRREKNIAFAQALAKGQLEYQERLSVQMAKGKELLTQITGRTTNEAAATDYGAREQTNWNRTPDVRPETQAQIAKYLEVVSRSDVKIDKALQIIDEDLAQLNASDDERKQVYDTLRDTARKAIMGESDWFAGVDFKMRNPAEVASALGATTLKRVEKGEK